MKEQQEKNKSIRSTYNTDIIYISVCIRHRNSDDFPGKKGNKNRGI